MKKLSIMLALCAWTSIAFAQWGEEGMAEKPSFKDRIFTGGSFGGGFSSYYSFISATPLVGVSVTPKLATGVQFTYRYSKYNYSNGPDVSYNDFGVSPFVRFQVFGPVFLHAEYEYLSYQYQRTQSAEIERRGFNSFMAGGGFFQPVGRRAGFFLLALYNFSYSASTYSPYASPWVLRAGITAGF